MWECENVEMWKCENVGMWECIARRSHSEGGIRILRY